MNPIDDQSGNKVPGSRTTPHKDIIQSLWIGPKLSVMERLCIRSFLHHGHEFHLFVYEEPLNVPAGTVLEDAGKILPAHRVFRYSEHETVAGFSNFFRYKLLLEQGGWWVDTDMICLAPFDFCGPYVFSSEGIEGSLTINTGAIKALPQSPLIQRAWNECEQMDPKRLQWGQSGPQLMTRLVCEGGLVQHVRLPEVFCPVHYSQWRSLLDSTVKWDFPAETRAVHLWNECWRRAGQDKNRTYNPSCLYEELKRKYLGEE